MILIGVFFICFLIFLMLFFYKKSQNIFNPMSYIILFFLIRNTMFLLKVCSNPDSMNSYLPVIITDPDLLLLKYFLFQTIFFSVFSGSYCIFAQKRLLYYTVNIKSRNDSESIYIIRNILYLSFIFSLITFMLYFFKVGSLYEIINNFAYRTEHIDDNIFIQLSVRLAPLVLFSALYLYIKKQIKYITFIMYSLYVVISLLGFGSRTLAFTPILGGFVIWSILTGNAKIKTFKKFLLPTICLFPFLIIVSDLRKPQKVDLLFSEPVEYFLSIFEDDSSESFVAEQLSSVRTSLFILNHYNEYNMWYGKSIIDLLYAPIPRKFFANKPPVDTGRYITAAAIGQDFQPPTPLSKLPPYGWPPGSMELGYINFGLFGIMLIGILHGFILSYICNKCIMKIEIKTFFYIVIYFYAIQLFNLTNSGLFTFLTRVATFYILYKFSSFFINKKRYFIQ